METHTAVAQREPQSPSGAEVLREVKPEATGDWPVVILSGGVTGLGVLRAFARRGIRAYVYPAIADDVARRSRWFAPLPGCGVVDKSPTPSLELLERILAGSGLARACLFACSDDWNRLVAEYLARGGERFVGVVPHPSALATLQNKGQFALLLQRLGAPMPKTRLISSAADIPELPQSDETFFFLKPTDSQSFLEHFGTKGLRVRTADDARRRLDEVTAAGMSVVLQEYIPGPFSDHYFVDGYVDRQGAILALFPRRRLRIYPPDFGNSTSMVTVPLADVEGAVDTLKRVLAAVSYRGIFSAEFKRDARDGLFKLLEVNARPWWFIDFAVRSGVDVCRMAYDDALGRAVPPLEGYRIGATCIYPYYDFFAMRPLVRSGRAGWGRWVSELARALQPIACWDDPLPGIAGFAGVLSAALHRVTRRRA
jgi:predicted ATP-grasp superfamily ATP-dependent carboligase